MKKYSKEEKILLACSGDDYVAYNCDEHGAFLRRKDVDIDLCPYCKKKANPINNLLELRTEFRKELNFK